MLPPLSKEFEQATKDARDTRALVGSARTARGRKAWNVASDNDLLAEAFLRQFTESWPSALWQDVTIVAAVSGGADSVALLHSLIRVSPGGSQRLVVAHVDHGLRGRESEDDAQFVADLCAQLGVRCEIQRLAGAVFAATGGEGIESVARRARYEHLQAVAAQCGARHVVTGHTADDQAETILLRILRGTGLRGLAGIPRVRSLSPGLSLIRPLLGFSRQEVLAFLAALGQPFREDATNRDPRFRRNQLRQELMPLLIRDYNPNLPDALIRLAALAGQTQALVDRLVERLAERAVRPAHGGVEIDCALLSQEEAVLVRELLQWVWTRQRWPLRQMNYAKWQQLAELVQSPWDGRRCQTFPGGIQAERRETCLHLRK